MQKLSKTEPEPIACPLNKPPCFFILYLDGELITQEEMTLGVLRIAQGVKFVKGEASEAGSDLWTLYLVSEKEKN